MKKIYALIAIACLTLTANAQDLRVQFDTYSNNQVVTGPVGSNGFGTIALTTDFSIINDGGPIAVGDTIVLGYQLNGTLFSLGLTQGSFNFVTDTVIPTGDTLRFSSGGLFLGFPSTAVAGDQSTLCVYASLVGADAFAAAAAFDTTYNNDLTPSNNLACVIYELDGTIVGLEENLKELSNKTYIANNQLVIENSEFDFNSPATVNVINLTGQVVQTKELLIQRGQNTIGLNNLSTGIYVVSIQVENKVSTTKVMVR